MVRLRSSEDPNRPVETTSIERPTIRQRIGERIDRYLEGEPTYRDAYVYCGGGRFRVVAQEVEPEMSALRRKARQVNAVRKVVSKAVDAAEAAEKSEGEQRSKLVRELAEGFANACEGARMLAPKDPSAIAIQSYLELSAGLGLLMRGAQIVFIRKDGERPAQLATFRTRGGTAPAGLGAGVHVLLRSFRKTEGVEQSLAEDHKTAAVQLAYSLVNGGYTRTAPHGSSLFGEDSVSGHYVGLQAGLAVPLPPLGMLKVSRTNQSLVGVFELDDQEALQIERALGWSSADGLTGST